MRGSPVWRGMLRVRDVRRGRGVPRDTKLTERESEARLRPIWSCMSRLCCVFHQSAHRCAPQTHIFPSPSVSLNVHSRLVSRLSVHAYLYVHALFFSPPFSLPLIERWEVDCRQWESYFFYFIFMPEKAETGCWCWLLQCRPLWG